MIGFRTAISDGEINALITLVELLKLIEEKGYMKFPTLNLNNDNFNKNIIRINQ